MSKFISCKRFPGQTFSTLEGLEDFDDLDRTKDIRVLRSDLNHDGKILADVDFEHLLDTFQRLFGGQLAEIVDEPLY